MLKNENHSTELVKIIEIKLHTFLLNNILSVVVCKGRIKVISVVYKSKIIKIHSFS